MKDENQEEIKKSPFDLYFDECQDDFIIKLYEKPHSPGRRAAKEWIEDFENEKPSEEYITTMYGAGHYWVMGIDKDGKIKSKDIVISDRAVQRIQKKSRGAAQMEDLPINSLAGGRGNNGIVESVGILKELISGVIAPLISANQKPVSQLDQFEEMSSKMIKLFEKNLEMVNNQMIGYTKKIASEQMADKKEEKEENSQGWIGDLISGIKPYIDKFLDAKGLEAAYITNQINQNPLFKTVQENDNNLNAFFNA
ncbi:MAG: hypothetical protein R3321_14930, partial [Nitrososphaeraceae archaeon]|nr:hypothetical protein [Nitrososphaeraceae archaeon]